MWADKCRKIHISESHKPGAAQDYRAAYTPGNRPMMNQQFHSMTLSQRKKLRKFFFSFFLSFHKNDKSTLYNIVNHHAFYEILNNMIWARFNYSDVKMSRKIWWIVNWSSLSNTVSISFAHKLYNESLM